METEQQILCLAARTQLEPDAEARLLCLLHRPLNWERLWIEGYVHEVLPLLFSTLREFVDVAPIPPPWMQWAQRQFYATLLRNTTLLEELVRVLTAFQAIGIEPLSVKGLVLAQMVYGHLALRPAKDLDILVRSQDLPAARQVLRQQGFTARTLMTFADVHHAYHDPQYFRQTDRGEVCLELHWSLWSPHFFQPPCDGLWECTVDIQMNGVPIRTLSLEDTLLHLAIHRARSPLRLRFVCDIAELLRGHGEAINWEYVLRQANQVGARTALYLGLFLSQELLGARLPPTLLPELSISRFKHRLINHTGGVDALFHRQPYPMLRMLEQDGIQQIVRAMGYYMTRTAKRRLFTYQTGRGTWTAPQ